LAYLKENSEKFRDYSPDQLIEYQQNADNGHRYDILDELQSFVSKIDGRVWTKRGYYGRAKSFFAHNRAELPTDRGFIIRSEIPASKGDLSLEELKRVLDSCSLCYRAALMSMFQAGLGKAEFLYWNMNGLEQLKRDLAGEARVFKIDLAGRKSRRNQGGYYTFIGEDAIDLLRAWWKIRPSDAKALFVNQYGEPIQNEGLHAYFISHLAKCGLVKRGHDMKYRSGKGLHELRDLFRSQWAKSPAKGEYAEFFMGHQVDPFGYNKSYRDVEAYRAEYLKAMPYLNIYSSGRPFHQVAEEEVEDLRAEVQTLRQRLQTVEEARSKTDGVMDRLFQDPKFMEALKERLRELKP
jgi:integrase